MDRLVQKLDDGEWVLPPGAIAPQPPKEGASAA